MENNVFSYERARLLMAYELNIPPDDIDLSSLLTSIFRAIRESCDDDHKQEIILTIKNEKEEEAILGEHGEQMIERILSDEYPFEGIADQYEDWYVSNILNKIDEGEI